LLKSLSINERAELTVVKANSCHVLFEFFEPFSYQAFWFHVRVERMSEIVISRHSVYFTVFHALQVRSPIVLEHLRCRFACFKLCAHFLYLSRLFLHRCYEGCNFLLLLSNSHLEVFPLL
jgi:hypothetical protein